MIKNAKVILFDADDTLWENETLFRTAEHQWADVLADYGDFQHLSNQLYNTEAGNMELLGYGAKAFMISLIETSIKVTNGRLTAEQLEKILNLSKELLLKNPATPYPGVENTLKSLKHKNLYKLVLVTKGDLLDQEHKIERSGLSQYFDYIKIISNKDLSDYQKILDDLSVNAENVVSVGNSFKSDIQPILELGGWAIHIPAKELWQHEITTEFEHERLIKISKFGEILNYL